MNIVRNVRTVFIGDFNVNTSDSSMKEFGSLNGLKNLINEPTYKNSEKPTCIDLILTNQLTILTINQYLQNEFPKMQAPYYYFPELQKL